MLWVDSILAKVALMRRFLSNLPFAASTLLGRLIRFNGLHVWKSFSPDGRPAAGVGQISKASRHSPSVWRLRGTLLVLFPGMAHCADGAGWRDYALYQPTIERVTVLDASKAALRYNHDSSIAWFGDRWFCVWNGNSVPQEGAPGQLNYVSTSKDVLNWSSPQPAFSDATLTTNPVSCLQGSQWQPNLLVTDNSLWCLWSQWSDDGNEGCYFSVLETPDGRWTNRLLTWDGRVHPVIDGKPYRVFPTQNPLRLSSGRVLAPVTLIGPTSDSAPASKSDWYGREKRNSVIYTDDGGKSWQVSPGTILPGLDWRQWEPTVFEQPDGSVMMFARNNQVPEFEGSSAAPAETLTWSISHDGGSTWSPHEYVPLQTVVSRMHVLRQEGSDRYFMIHNDWLAGRHYNANRRNLALYVNRGGGIDFVAGIGLTDRVPEVCYPQMFQHGDSLAIAFSKGPVAERSIDVVKISPVPAPDTLYIYPRSNLPTPPRLTAIDDETFGLSGGAALKYRTAPSVSPEGFSFSAWVKPQVGGVLFDNRSSTSGLVWGLSGTWYVNLGEPAQNIRSTLRVPHDRWSYTGLTVDYAKGRVDFYVDQQRETVKFEPGRRSMSSSTATLGGSNQTRSSLTPFEGTLHRFTVHGANRLGRADHGLLALQAPGGTTARQLVNLAGQRSVIGDFILPPGSQNTPDSITAGNVDSRKTLRFAGTASAGVELEANNRARGDTVEMKFSFRIETGSRQTICTVGDANEPARIKVEGNAILLSAGGQTIACGSVKPGFWHELFIQTRQGITRAQLDGQPAVELAHNPKATWIYLGEGYRSSGIGPDAAFTVDATSIRSRVERGSALTSQ